MKKRELGIGFGIIAAYCVIGAGIYAYKKLNRELSKKYYVEMGDGIKVKKGTIIPVKNKFTWNSESDEVIAEEDQTK